jgi:hypothetical protein
MKGQLHGAFVPEITGAKGTQVKVYIFSRLNFFED